MSEVLLRIREGVVALDGLEVSPDHHPVLPHGFELHDCPLLIVIQKHDRQAASRSSRCSSGGGGDPQAYCRT
jgi:hypothetical protein